MLGFALSYVANICIFMILYDFCLFPAYFSYTVIYERKFESHLEITNRCAPWKVASCTENPALQSLQFHEMCIRRKFPGGTNKIYRLAKDKLEIML